MIKVAVTGEMGSGKSYCAKIFEQLGVPVFYTDDVARLLINQDKELKQEVQREFGNIYVNGKVDPKLLREKKAIQNLFIVEDESFEVDLDINFTSAFQIIAQTKNWLNE